ncbi:2-oxoglutarate dehydrogenase E1 subunit family protein, partial [Agromyces agglutinans]|uniref:2-oxoglutarate dehydrogenase E1 subunit family protein n=1 Tax=Agromyces agglutinans TaxID=2662258 RepID=UPI0028A90BD7
MSSQLTGSGSEETTAAEFGANEWLVDEMYQKYLVDPSSVDRTWWPVLEQYRQHREQAGATPDRAPEGQPAPEASDQPGAPAAEASAQPAPKASAQPAPEAPAAPAAAEPA